MAVSVQRVGAVLRKAGHARSECHRSGRVRGWTKSTTGYRVAKSHKGGAVLVWHVFGDWRREGDTDETRQEWLKKYQESLRAAGVECEITGSEIVVGG